MEHAIGGVSFGLLLFCFVEVLWRSGALEGRNSLENGSLESGSFRKDIITQMEAFANRGGGKFAEWLRFDK